MGLRDKCIEFWRGPRAAEISYPKHRGRWPDRDHVDILRRLCTGLVCEVGCGTGRCSDAFAPDRYIGLDINPDAIRIARFENPQHTFRLIDWDSPYPHADTYLFHTCLQHVPDDEVEPILARCQGRVVIAEFMVPEYRDPKRLCFHRGVTDYARAFGRLGIHEVKVERYPTTYQLKNPALPPLTRHFMIADATNAQPR